MGQAPLFTQESYDTNNDHLKSYLAYQEVLREQGILDHITGAFEEGAHITVAQGMVISDFVFLPPPPLAGEEEKEPYDWLTQQRVVILYMHMLDTGLEYQLDGPVSAGMYCLPVEKTLAELLTSLFLGHCAPLVAILCYRLRTQFKIFKEEVLNSGPPRKAKKVETLAEYFKENGQFQKDYNDLFIMGRSLSGITLIENLLKIIAAAIEEQLHPQKKHGIKLPIKRKEMDEAAKSLSFPMSMSISRLSHLVTFHRKLLDTCAVKIFTQFSQSEAPVMVERARSRSRGARQDKAAQSQSEKLLADAKKLIPVGNIKSPQEVTKSLIPQALLKATFGQICH